jgi:competence protein ComFC
LTRIDIQEGIRQVWNGVLDVVYPPRCLLCGREPAEPFCEICQRAILPVTPPFCDRCGIPVEAGRLVCYHCETGPEPAFAWSQALGQYAGTLRQAIHQLKYDGKTALAQPLGLLLARSLETPSPLLKNNEQGFDAVVPVPLHPARYRERGFNQAERIARVLAQERGWPLDTQGLRRLRQTPSQTALSASARRANVAGAFDTRSPHIFQGQSVLLLDDVLTTSATTGECARVLRNAGATRVAVLALARGR